MATIMRQVDPFLDAILAEPDDHSHRLVYADWLMENGQPDRAEFIRLQLARRDRHPADPANRASLVREAELLAMHELAWLGPLVHLTRRCRFHGGFVEEVTLNFEQLLAHGEQLFRRAPIRRLRMRKSLMLPSLLREDPRSIDRLAELLGRITVLDLNRDAFSEPAGLALLSLPKLPRLRELRLAGNALSPAGVAVLADSPVFDTLTTLEFNTTSRETVDVLLRSRHLGQLQHLSLAFANHGDRIVGQLIGSGILPRLRSLSLAHVRISAAGLSELLAESQVAGLESLDLSFNTLELEGAGLLARSPHLEQLDSLNLSRTALGDGGTQLLASSPLFGQLHGLDLSLDRIGNAGALALAHSRQPAALGTLDLIYNDTIGLPAREALRERFGEEVCLFTR